MCGSEIKTKEVNSSNGVYLLFLAPPPRHPGAPPPRSRGFPLSVGEGSE